MTTPDPVGRPAVESALDERILGQALDHSPDGMVIAGEDGRIAYVNRALVEMTGFRSDELIGHPVEKLVPSRHHSQHRRSRENYVRDPRTRPMGTGLQLTAMCADGSEIPVEISLSPVATGSRSYTIASIRDITARLAAEDVLRSTSDALILSAERERIARDLHDTVLQRLYGLGLELQAIGINTDDKVTARIETGIDEIDHIIREIRTSVFTLGAAQRAGSLGQELGDIIAQSSRVLGFSPRLRIQGPVEHSVSEAARLDLVATLRESLANVARHSRATAVTVEIDVADSTLHLRVGDNGTGLPADLSGALGNGLRNMTERARQHGGTLFIGRSAEGGALIEWTVPVD